MERNLAHRVDTKWRRRRLFGRYQHHRRDESASSPLGGWQVLYRSRDVRRWPDAITDSSNDNLDRMTAKLVSTPTLGRALRFWRELYVDAESWGLGPPPPFGTCPRCHWYGPPSPIRYEAPQSTQLRVRVVRCALL